MGKWLPLQDAFAFATEIEGSEELAFQRLCTLLVNGSVPVRCARRTTQWPKQDGEVSVIKVDKDFWRFITMQIEHGHFMIEERDVVDNDDVLLIGSKFEIFTLSHWQMLVHRMSLEQRLADHDIEADDNLRVAPAREVKKGAGGAPQKYDWAGAAAFATALMVEEDPPQAKVIAEIEGWFSKRGREPAAGEVRRWVASMFSELKSHGKA